MNCLVHPVGAIFRVNITCCVLKMAKWYNCYLQDIVLLLKTDLCQNSGQQLVDVVIYSDWNLNELCSKRARQTFSVYIYIYKKYSINLIWFELYMKSRLPCEDTARERAKSILLATRIMARVRSSSMSINEASSCSACVNDDLSTTE